MDYVWDLVSDQKILALLIDVRKEINGDVTRLLFIDLLKRIQSLEEENLTMRVLLEEMELVDGELFQVVRQGVKEFLKIRDGQKTTESSFFSTSGVSFPQWVNFKLTGKFEEEGV